MADFDEGKVFSKDFDEGKLLRNWVIGSLVAIALLTWLAWMTPKEPLFIFIMLSFGCGSLAHATWAERRRDGIRDREFDWYRGYCKQRHVKPVSFVPNLFENKWKYHYELLRETERGDPFDLLRKAGILDDKEFLG